MAQENVNFVLAAKNLTGDAFKSVRAGLSGLGEQVSSVRGLMATLGAAIGAGSFAAGVKAAMEAADAAAKAGDRFGIATEKMIGMQHAGDLAGASNQAIAMGLKEVAKQGTEAARGSEDVRKNFQLLNIEYASFVKLPLDEQFATVIDRLGKVENVALRNTLANQMMGKSYGELMGLVAEGSEAFKKAQEDAEAWGLAINRVDAAKIEMANDAMTRAMATTKGLFTTISVYLSPAIKAMGDAWADSAADAKGFKEEVASGSEVVISAIGYTANVVQGLRFAYAAVKLAVAEVADFTLRSFAFIAERIEFVGKVVSYLPGPMGVLGKVLQVMSAQGSEALKNMAESTTNTAAQLRIELDAIAEQGLPYEQIIAKIRAMRAVMDEEAKQVAKRRQEMMKGSGLDILEDKKESSYLQDLAKRVERIQIENFTEMQMLEHHLVEKQNAIDAAARNNLLSDEAWQAQTAMLTYKHEQDKTALIDAETRKRFGIQKVYRDLDLESTAFVLNQLSGLMNSHHRAQFEIGKAAAVGMTMINTYKAAVGAASAVADIPYVGEILAAAAYASMMAMGMQAAHNIRTMPFGGSGGGATPVFAASSTTGIATDQPGGSSMSSFSLGAGGVVNPQLPKREVHITLIGQGFFSQDDIREKFIPALREAIGDGVTLSVD